MRILYLRFSNPAVIKAFKETMIFIVRDFFEETARAEIQLTFGALPADPQDLFGFATSTTDSRMLHSKSGVINNLRIQIKLKFK